MPARSASSLPPPSFAALVLCNQAQLLGWLLLSVTHLGAPAVFACRPRTPPAGRTLSHLHPQNDITYPPPPPHPAPRRRLFLGLAQDRHRPRIGLEPFPAPAPPPAPVTAERKKEILSGGMGTACAAPADSPRRVCRPAMGCTRLPWGCGSSTAALK